VRLAGLALLAAACSTATRAAPPLAGPSNQPVWDLPERAALVALPQGDAEWSALGQESAELLARYLRINTTNPPGNELAAARFLAAVLEREGIESKIFEPSPGKANLYARLRGDGSGRPIILLNHMDVVLASPEYWTVPPFSGVIRDGAVWGRGALDMKGQGIAQLMAMIVLKRANVPLKRDVIFLATADEETATGVGAGWIVAEERELVAGAEFLINEGGTIRAETQGRVQYHGINVTEKTPFWLDVTARGTAGHGSRPTPDNPVHRLTRALSRIAAYETPLVVTPVVDAYFKALAPREVDRERRAWYGDIGRALRDTAAARSITADLTHNALLRNTISITGLRGSDKTNVIPPVATAAIDVRLLPGQSPQTFLAALRSVVDDSLIEIKPQVTPWTATESPMDTELYRAVSEVARRHHPDALVVPVMLAGFTDSHFFREIGITSYGVSPFPLSEAISRGVHGNDERLPLDALRFGTRFMFEIVYRVAAR
jgi:acetylornithine deacetylase/succinyl-diaminopimelate desuccinylase-like protein